MNISKIQKMDEECAEGYKEVSKEAMLFYQKHFTYQDTTTDLSLLIKSQ